MKDRLTETAKSAFLAVAKRVFPQAPHAALHRLGDLVGPIMIGEKGRIIREELGALLPELSSQDLDDALYKAMRNFRKDLFEIWSFPGLTQEKVNRLCILEGREHLDKALEKGKGAIICLTHFGSWKIVLPALAFNGYSVHQVAADPMTFVRDGESPAHNQIMSFERQCEASLPVQFIYVNDKAVHKPLYKALQKNEIVVVALDGVLGRERLFCDFLAGSLGLSTGPASLAHRTGSALLPEFAIRGSDNRHRVTMHPPLDVSTELDRETFIRQWCERFARLFAAQVRQHPDHYARFLFTLRKYPVEGIGSVIRAKEAA